MAEGGEDNYPYYLDEGVDYGDDADDDEQEGNSWTQPFQAGAASTPYGGEHVEIETMQHEHIGLPAPPSCEETSFGGTTSERAPLLQDDSLTGLEARLDNLKRNPLTGILDISSLSSQAIENPLSLEEQKEEIEKAKRFVKNLYPRVDFSKLGPIHYSSKRPLVLVVIGPRATRRLSFLKTAATCCNTH